MFSWRLLLIFAMRDIDIVVPWVDGNDPLWKAEKAKYSKTDSNMAYYRDWGLMRYWFRGVEKNLPWLRYVFFITCGHLPKWLNTNHPKLKIINHKDFIPSEFLPTFSAIPIGSNYHRIESLSEQYIAVDDDVFFVGYTKPEDYFSEEGLPKDFLWLRPITEMYDQMFAHLKLNTLLLINKKHSVSDIPRELLESEEYPREAIEDNIKYSSLKSFPGFKDLHTTKSVLKSTQREMWEEEWLSLYEMCHHKFRTLKDAACLEREWNLAIGKFVPHYPKGHCYTDTADKRLGEKILNPEVKVICINESEKENYSEKRAAEIASYLEERLPEKSEFELF